MNKKIQRPIWFWHPPRFLIIVLTLVPIVGLILLLYTYAVDVPIADQWLMAHFFDYYFHDSLSFSHFWNQYNEHRIVFPKLIMLGLGLLTGYNVLYENALSVIFGLSSFFIVVWHLHRNKEVMIPEPVHKWLYVMLSCLIFSLYQYIIWFFGFQMQWLLNVLAIWAGAFIVSNCITNIRNFIYLILIGLAASFSSANGLLYWIVLGLVFLLKKWRGGARKEYTAAIASFFIFTLILVVYLIGYQKPASHPDPWYVLKHPLEYIHYIFAFIGSPFTKARNLAPGLGEILRATVFGMAGVILFFFFGVYNYIKKPAEEIRPQLFFIFAGLYSLATAAMIALGRVGFGVDQAIESRYGCVSIMLWCSVFFMVFTSGIHREIKTGWLKRMPYYSKCALILYLFLAVNFSSINTIRNIRRHHANLECIRLSMIYDVCRECVGFPNLEWLYEYGLPVLKKWKLSVYSLPPDEAVLSKVPRDQWRLTPAWSLENPDRDIPSLTGHEYFFGAFNGSEEKVGLLESSPFLIDGPIKVIIPFMKNKAGDKQKVGVRIKSEKPLELVCTSFHQTGNWGCCSFDLTEYKGYPFTIFAEDVGTGEDEWLALGQPVLIRSVE